MIRIKKHGGKNLDVKGLIYSTLQHVLGHIVITSYRNSDKCCFSAIRTICSHM